MIFTPSVFQSATRPRGRGDPSRICSVCWPRTFQSAPRPRGRGDPVVQAQIEPGRCFNPRPAHAGGATSGQRLGPADAAVSIRAPPTRAGRPVRASLLARRRLVSIRAPPTRAGRHGKLDRNRHDGAVSIRAPPTRAGRHEPTDFIDLVGKFQSAPRPRGRGDIHGCGGG